MCPPEDTTKIAVSSGGRVSQCPNETTHTCGKCEAHCPCPECMVRGCHTPRDCRRYSICFMHCLCNSHSQAPVGRYGDSLDADVDEGASPPGTNEYSSVNSEDRIVDEEVRYFEPEYGMVSGVRVVMGRQSDFVRATKEKRYSVASCQARRHHVLRSTSRCVRGQRHQPVI